MLNHDQTRKEPQQFGLLQAANTCTPSADGILPVRSFITERKYEQIMSCTENDLHHFTAAGKVVDRSAAELVIVGNYSIRHKRKSSSSSNPGDVEEYHHKTISKKAKRLTRSSSSPGSNSSDVTTEQYMAESSKSSSCFDDACTLAPDQAPEADAADAVPIVPHGDPPEKTIDVDQSGASASEPIQKSCNDEDQDHQVLDLNGVPVLTPQQQQQTAEIGNFSRHQMVDLLLKSEESELLGINRRSFMNQAEAAGECIEYYSSSNSWLQLGLGLSSSSRSPEVLPKTTTAKPHELLVAEHSAAEEDEEADGSRQQKQVLHLFPSESVQISEYASPGQALASKQLISASTSSARSGEIDQRLAIAGSDFHGLGRFGKAAAEESRGRQQELTGFLKSLKEGPDTELVISYNNNTSTSTTTGYAVHAADDHQLQFRQQNRSPPQLISSSPALMMNSFGDQSYYQESASDQVQQHGGYASTSSYDQFNVSFPQQQQQQLQQPFEDSRHSIQRGYNSTAAAAVAKSRSQQQDSHLWPKRDQSLTTPYFTPSRAPDVFVPMQAASPFHTAASRLSLPSQQSEDWQTLIKRLGGSNMQFQSFFNPGLTKASADGFLEEMQQQRRRNLQDLQAHWNSTSQETAARSISHASAAAGSGAAAPWSRQLLTGGGTQDISMKTTMPFSFPSFDGLSFSSRVAATNLQAWPPSAAGSLLPFLPNISHDQQQQQHQFFPDHLTTTDQRRKLTPVNDHDTWFFLRAGAANQDNERLLPQIPKGYLRVKDGGTVPVSHVKKYLVHKLGLSCESEVEISCRGHILPSSLSLQHVRDVIWHSSTATTAEETSSSRNTVMELNYSKRLLQFHHS